MISVKGKVYNKSGDNMKNCLLIINPASGQKKIKRKAVDVIEIFNRAGWKVSAFTTLGVKDARKIVVEYGKEHDVIVCCGGDGTLNEVSDAIIESGCNCPIGYIPCGTTNDFASSMNIPLDIEAAAAAITEGNEYKRDIGMFNGRVFTYIASFGLFSEASYNAPQSAKNTLGSVAYILEGMKDIVSIKSIHARIEADGKIIEDDFVFGAIANTTSIGGILKLDKEAVSFNDGKLEMLLIKMPKTALDLSDILVCLRRGNYDSTHIMFFQASQIRIDTEQPIPYTLDGEFFRPCSEVKINAVQNGITYLFKNPI